MARPKKEKTMTKVVTIKLSDEHFARLLKVADENLVNPTLFVRNLIIKNI
jgi:hypothetical protein